MAPHTTLERLRTFHSISSTGTIAGAARRLGYTPSAVSQQLSALERETRVALVERSNRGVSLTAAGVVLAERASDILDLVQSTLEAASSASGDFVTPVRLAAFPTAITTMLLPLRTRLDSTVHLSIIDVESETALQALIARQVDAAIIDGDAGDRHADRQVNRLHRMVLRAEPVRMVARADRQVVSLESCADVPWVLGGPGSRLGDAMRALCRTAGFEPHVVVETDDHHVTFEAISAINAVSVLPALALADLPGTIRIASDIALPIERRIEFVTRQPLQRNSAVATIAQLLADERANER